MTQVVLLIRQILALMLILHYTVPCIESIVNGSDCFFPRKAKRIIWCKLWFCMLCQLYFHYFQRTCEISLMTMDNTCSVCIGSF